MQILDLVKDSVVGCLVVFLVAFFCEVVLLESIVISGALIQIDG